jgi:hypothetical protein
LLLILFSLIYYLCGFHFLLKKLIYNGFTHAFQGILHGSCYPSTVIHMLRPFNLTLFKCHMYILMYQWGIFNCYTHAFWGISTWILPHLDFHKHVEAIHVNNLQMSYKLFDVLTRCFFLTVGTPPWIDTTINTAEKCMIFLCNIVLY